MKAFTALALSLFSGAVLAFPEAPFDALQVKLKSNLSLNQEYDFEGIVKLSNCSGSLISFPGQPDTARAIVMTNGHCIQKPGGYLTPGEVWVNRPVKREMQIFDKSMKLFPVKATKILYATMTDTDLAYYQLKETYQEIESKFNIRPFVLDNSRPSQGTAIEIISGYWDRGYSCNIDGFVHNILEGNWIFTDSIRYTEECNTIGGTSGSPIIQAGTKTVIGINNTSNVNGEECTLNNPCEVDELGQRVARKGVRYGQQTYQTYSCLTSDFKINLAKRGCSLPK